MKREYVRPTAVCEIFEVNDYVAACGMKPDGTYHFKCDAPAGKLYYYRGRQAQLLGDYHPCSATHETKNKNNFYEGFVDYNKNGKEDAGEHVVVWRGDSGWNGHATVSLTMGQLQTQRS